MKDITNHYIPITRQSPITTSPMTKRPLSRFGDSVIGDWDFCGDWCLAFGDSAKSVVV
jgi:hypothetical protein